MAVAFERNRLRAICFDVDGTLRDTDDQFVMRLARLISPLASLTRTGQPKDLARRIVMAIENPGNSLLTLGDRLGIDGLMNRIGD
jgi:FMN phosphatase YigB (HAD superfamily)